MEKTVKYDVLDVDSRREFLSENLHLIHRILQFFPQASYNSSEARIGSENVFLTWVKKGDFPGFDHPCHLFFFISKICQKSGFWTIPGILGCPLTPYNSSEARKSSKNLFVIWVIKGDIRGFGYPCNLFLFISKIN